MCLFHCLASTLPHSFRVSVSPLSEILPTNLSNSAKNSALSVSCAPSTDVSGYAPAYALSTLPLIARVSQPNLTQTWFADDAGAGASLQSLHRWWTALSEVGPKYGYHVNPPPPPPRHGCLSKTSTRRQPASSSRTAELRSPQKGDRC